MNHIRTAQYQAYNLLIQSYYSSGRKGFRETIEKQFFHLKKQYKDTHMQNTAYLEHYSVLKMCKHAKA